MSNNPSVILQQLIDILRISNVSDHTNSLKHEYIFYRFCTDYVQKSQDRLQKLMQPILRKIISLIRLYARFKGIVDPLTTNLLCQMYLTTTNSYSTGSIVDSWTDIEAAIDTNGNIREIFYLIDEFLHQGCAVMNHLLYEADWSDPIFEQINQTYLEQKIRLNGTNIGLDSDGPIDSVRQSIKTKLSTSNLPSNSICQLWNNKNTAHPVNRLQSVVEYNRLVPFLSHSDVFCIRSLDDRLFKVPKICDDKIRSQGISSFPIFSMSTVTYPALSDRELKWCLTKNPNCMYDQIIPWKSGCCYYQPSAHSVMNKVSELFSCANRVTSLSGHTIIELDLFKLLDKDFDTHKESYVIYIMASMIPYGHHSAHEILSPASYFGITYDLTADTFSQIKNICPDISDQILLSYEAEFDRLLDIQSS